MLIFSYLCTATDSWGRIIESVQVHGMAGVAPSDPVRIGPHNGWTFKTTIQGLTSAEELLLLVKFSGDNHLTVQQV